MNKGRLLLVFGITLIFIVCFSFMNYRYDSLSRYPYQDEEARAIIKEKLNKEEIEYIIEYSIAPYLFMDYINEDGFNIYRIKEYNDLNRTLWMYPKDLIVKMVEETYMYVDGNTLGQLMLTYQYNDLLFWFKNKDKYNENSILVSDAYNLLAYVDDTYTVSTRVPHNLIEIDDFIPHDEGLYIDSRIDQPLKALCNSIEEELGSKCGGLKIEEAYVSYDNQVQLFNSVEISDFNEKIKNVDIPGHSEHQLGLAVDFYSINNENFTDTKEYEWLLNNAYRYGFIQTYSESKSFIYNKKVMPNHFRFVGVDIAKHMYINNLSLKELSEN